MSQESIQYGESSKEASAPQLKECFEKGVCPFCEHQVEDATTAKTHYGFCSEHHLSSYEPASVAEIETQYEQWEPGHVHQEWVQQFASELGVSEEVVRELHDTQGLTPREIREQVAQDTEQADAA